MSWRVGLNGGAAREHVRVARALRDLPQVGEALRIGQMSYSKVRALTRIAKAENEGALLEMARSSTASQLERICRGYQRALRSPIGERPEGEVATRWVRERGTDAGLVRFEVQLAPEEAAVVRRALDVAMSRAWTAADCGDAARELAAGRCLVAVAEHFLTAATDAARSVLSLNACSVCVRPA